ncbi:MAG: TIGR03746 family integrating conjugative element protein [Pseudomonadota bacterium]
MSQYSNLLAAKDDTIKTQRFVITVLALFVAALIVAVIMLPKKITVHVPPDLSGGVSTGMSDIPDPNVYTFAFYVFQQLNRWPVDGAADYSSRIHRLRNFMTPSCYQDRLKDHEQRSRNNEIYRRERAMWEIPGRGYVPSRVIKESNDSWLVSLDVHIQETMLGEKVKDRLVNFPIRVVRYPIDYELNPHQLALDCFAGTPRTIANDNVVAGAQPAKPPRG